MVNRFSSSSKYEHERDRERPRRPPRVSTRGRQPAPKPVIVRQEPDGLWTIRIDLVAARRASKHLSPDLHRFRGENVSLVRHPDGRLGLTDQMDPPPVHVSESDAERFVNHLIFHTLNIADARTRPKNTYVKIVYLSRSPRPPPQAPRPPPWARIVVPMQRRTPERRMRRDAPSKSTTLTMLARWVMSGDQETGEVAADALESGGYKDAADDVRLWMKEKSSYESRDGLLRRVRSELYGQVLSKGAWRVSKAARGLAARHYVAIYEPQNKRALLWERLLFKKGPPSWRIWGTYDLDEFSGNIRRLLDIMSSDIRSESSSSERQAEISRLLSASERSSGRLPLLGAQTQLELAQRRAELRRLLALFE